MAGTSGNPMEGRVEVCYSRVWGTVCNSGWTRSDAAVVCRQLGYSSSGNYSSILNTINVLYTILTIGATALHSTIFGRGSGPIFLHDVRCTGIENRLFDCPNGGIEINSCSHYSDAGVTCTTGNISIIDVHQSNECFY